ncbi:MAG: thioredoxin family protein [Rhizobacter sp.]|jgi:thioredoxin 1
MNTTQPYAVVAPDRRELDARPGVTLVEFGTDWCGFCQAAQPAIAAALASRDDVQHIKVEDGPGRALGRSYKVKLWPTLIVLHDGVEAARVVRPAGERDVVEALAKATHPSG